jgi:hypothetical protein
MSMYGTDSEMFLQVSVDVDKTGRSCLDSISVEGTDHMTAVFHFMAAHDHKPHV